MCETIFPIVELLLLMYICTHQLHFLQTTVFFEAVKLPILHVHGKEILVLYVEFEVDLDNFNLACRSKLRWNGFSMILLKAGRQNLIRSVTHWLRRFLKLTIMWVLSLAFLFYFTYQPNALFLHLLHPYSIDLLLNDATLNSTFTFISYN